MGIPNLRLMGYYKIKQGILQQNLSKCYGFKSADNMCEHFNKFTSSLMKERKEEMQNNIHG